MANEAKLTYASQVTLESSGASAANAAFVQADDTTLASANHSNYPLADFVLKTNGFGAALASTGSLTVNLYRVDQDIDGTAGDAPAPTASNRSVYVGSFVVPLSAASTGNLYIPLNDVPLSQVNSFYVENLTGQTLTAGWTLKATPKTYVPGT